MYHFVNFCISNFTAFGISEIILFSVFLQKVLFSVLNYGLKSSQNGTFSELVSWNSVSTELE